MQLERSCWWLAALSLVAAAARAETPAGGTSSTSASASDAASASDVSAIEVVPQSARTAAQGVAFSPDGKLAAFAHWVDSNDAAGLVTIWDLASLRMIRMFGGIGGTQNVWFTKSGREVMDGNSNAWEVDTGSRLSKEEVTRRDLFHDLAPRYQPKPGAPAPLVAPGIHPSEKIVKAFEVSPDGRYAVKTGQFGLDNYLVDLRNGSDREGFKSPAISPELAGASDGRILFAGSSGPTARIWDLATGNVVFEHSTLGRGAAQRPTIVLSRDGSAALLQGAGPDGRRAMIRDNLHPERSYVIDDALVHPTAFKDTLSGEIRFYPACISDDGRLARLTSSKGKYDDTYVEWDVAARKVVRELPSSSSGACAFGASRGTGGNTLPIEATSPDGRLTARECSLGDSPSGPITGGVCVTGPEGAAPRQIAAHLAYLIGLSFSSDGRFLISRGRDGTTRLWSAQTLALVATAVTTGHADYVVYTPDNFYMAAGGGFSAVAFRVGNRAYPFEQFDLKLNRPDLVLERLGSTDRELISAYAAAHRKRLAAAGKTEEQLGSLRDLPELTITEQPFLQVAQPKARIGIAVRGKAPIVRLDVYVNEVPIHGSKGLAIPPALEVKRTVEIELELKRPNHVRLSAVDEQGRESLAEELEIRGGVVLKGTDKEKDLQQSLTLGRKPDLYLVSIGVSEYQNPDYALRYAAKDAKDLAALLARKHQVASGWKPKVYRVPPDEYYWHIHQQVLTDKQATREKILAARALLEQASVDDVVMVFAAGHGLVDEQRDYYFGTYDIDAEHPAARGLSFPDLERLVDGLRSRKRLVILDTCHGGELDDQPVPPGPALGVQGAKVTALATRGIKKAAGVAPRADVQRIINGELFGDLRRRSGASVLASSAGAEVALESPQWNNGVFTYALIEALDNRADWDESNSTDLDELTGYVSARVQNLTLGAQHPTVRQGNFGNSFSLFAGSYLRTQPKWAEESPGPMRKPGP